MTDVLGRLLVLMPTSVVLGAPFVLPAVLLLMLGLS
jgi:hypothetical protein